MSVELLTCVGLIVVGNVHRISDDLWVLKGVSIGVAAFLVSWAMRRASKEAR